MLDSLANKTLVYPALTLRDVVLFPRLMVSLFVGREKSIAALRDAANTHNHIVLLTQRDASDDDPGPDRLYQVGTLATIEQTIALPDNTVKLLTEGVSRVRVVRFLEKEGVMHVKIEPIKDLDEQAKTEQTRELMASLMSMMHRCSELSERIADDLLNTLSKTTDCRSFGDIIAAHLSLDISKRQQILEERDPVACLLILKEFLSGEIEKLDARKSVRKRVKQQVEKSQREYYLTEQMKAIQRELEDESGDSGELSEFDAYAKRIKAAKMPKEAHQKAEKELKKLRGMVTMSAEASVIRNYLECLIDMPWRKSTRVARSLSQAKERLNQDHHALDQVKERVLEYLAVLQRRVKHKGAILCLVGPPGVGKTSLGRSIAEATNRKFVRVSLGGVRDEAEIRGHRRTYIGAMPGKIIQNLIKVGTRNPLFMLDEVDKMMMDFRGDASSALLEALDPEQNHAFVDHYLEVGYDLSDVLFIATANSLNIPPALLDRMEVIRLSGYTDEEKVEIANDFLLKRQLELNGLREDELNFSKKAFMPIIQHYTREAGVRDLERNIAKVCRKVLYSILAKDSAAPVSVTAKNLDPYLGPPKFRVDKGSKMAATGQVVGLAWTELGGQTLKIQSSVVSGSGKHRFTGKLGEVMQESIQIAVSLIRSRIESYEIEPNFYSDYDIHVHLPEGATPKDGPSAGSGMCVSILSALAGVNVYQDVAMTGEINLAGEVLPVGGLKEKLLAAHRAKIRKVMLPKDNWTDLADVPARVKKDIELIAVSNIDEVFKHALVTLPDRVHPISGSKQNEKTEKSKQASSVSSSVRH